MGNLQKYSSIHICTVVVAIVALVLIAAHKASAINQQPPTKHKKQIHTLKSSQYKYSPFFVPPPPAYAPSILSSSAYMPLSASNREQPKNSPYSKYVYSRDGYENTSPMKPNKYVTYWNIRN